MDEIKGYFSSSELIVPISESRNSKLTLSGKPTEHFESMTVGTITVNVTTDDSGDAGDSTITGWYKDEETGDWYYYDKNGKLVTGWFKDGGTEWYFAMSLYHGLIYFYPVLNLASYKIKNCSIYSITDTICA